MMLRRPRPLPVFLALSLAVLPILAHAQDVPVDAEKAVADKLNYQFANGIAAVAEDKIITVDDVRREIAPLLPQIQRESRNEREFNEKINNLQESIVQDLIDRVLIVKEFYKDEKRRVPASFIDNQVAEIIATQFEGDRSKYLSYLRGRGISQKDYRKEVEEDMIYGYMRQQQRKSASTISPVKIQTYYDENKERFYQEDQVKLRLIQFTRTAGETDEVLQEKADGIIAQLKAGGSFVDLARLYSQDSRRTKGGDWGWQRRSDLRKEFADVVFALESGETTAPLLMPEGAFVLHAEEIKRAGVPPINEVRDQIERALVQQYARQAQERWLEKLRRNGYVKHY
ncbi:MAG: peptidylprolyl isomerase [Candidatus Didemnitutus sp.]|nr:peptidylprolyl isomerase [Candidatus Didemnitutus sp.]